MDARRTGYGMIQPGAHPEFEGMPVKHGIGLGTALSNSFRAVKRGLGIEVPDLGPIQEQIAEKKQVNRYLQGRGNRIA